MNHSAAFRFSQSRFRVKHLLVEALEARIAPATLTAAGAPAASSESDDVLLPGLTTPTISVTVSPASVVEDLDTGFNPMTFTFTRSGPTTGAVTVHFTKTGTTDFFDDISGLTYFDPGINLALDGTGTIVFGDGEATKRLGFAFDHDTKVEADETVVLTVSSGSGYTVGGSPATGTVINDDTDVTLSIAPASVLEGSGGTPLTYTFTRTGVTTNALTVNFTAVGTAGSGDYLLSGAATFASNAGTVTFAPNATAATVTVAPVQDSILEGNETVILSVAAATGGNVYNAGSSITGTIVDDELDFGDAPAGYGTLLAANGPRHVASPTFHLGASVTGELDGQPNASATGDGADDGVTLPGILFAGSTASITVNASQAGKLDAFIDWNRNGTFDAGEKVFDNVALAAGSNTLSVAVPAGASLGTSFARFRLSSDGGHGPTGLAADGEVEDYAVTLGQQDVSVATTIASVTEDGAAALEYTFTRVGDNSQALVVNYSVAGSAHPLQDYTFSGVGGFDSASATGFLTIAAGQSSGVIKLLPVNDTLVEATEHATVSVAPGTAYVARGGAADGTITDNETATIAFVAASSSAPEETTPHMVGVKLTTFSPEGAASLQDPFTVYVTDITVPGAGVATGGAVDYAFSEQSLTFFGGDTGSTKMVSVTIVNDTLVEGNETFQLGLSGSSSIATLFPTLQPAITIDAMPHTVTIVDNDVIDLSLAKTADHPSVTPGTVFKYTLDYTNGGLATASGVKLADVIPMNTTFDLAHSSAGWLTASNQPLTGGEIAGTPIHYSLNSLDPSASGSVFLALKVNAAILSGSATIENTATISDDGSGLEKNPGDNTAIAPSVTLDAAPDLSLTQEADKLLIVRGDILRTTYTYVNDGNEGTSSAVIFAHVPAGATFNQAASTGGTWMPESGGFYSLRLRPLVPGAGGAVDFAVTVNTTKIPGLHQVDTEASIGDSGLNGTDPTPANNTATNAANPTLIYEGLYAFSTSRAGGVLGVGALPLVHVVDITTGLEQTPFMAYEASYRSGVRLAIGDLNGDGFDDIVTATRDGSGRIRAFNGQTQQQILIGGDHLQIDAFRGHAAHGAYLALSDVNGDGRLDIIAGSGLGGGTVKVFNGRDGSLLETETPFGPHYTGGVRVAGGDVNGDGRDDVIAAMGAHGSKVKVFFGDKGPDPLLFNAGAPHLRDGIFVATGDTTGDGLAEIIVGRGRAGSNADASVGVFRVSGGAPTFSADSAAAHPRTSAAVSATEIKTIPLSNSTYLYGARVAATDINFDGIADIVVGAGPLGKSQAQILDGVTGNEIRNFEAFPGSLKLGLWTAAGAPPLPRLL